MERDPLLPRQDPKSDATSPPPGLHRRRSSSGRRRRAIFLVMPVVMPQRRFLAGVGLLLCVVVLWTFSSFITSDLLGGGYDKPFLITYLNTSAFAFYLLPSMFKRYKKGPRNDIETSKYQPLPPNEPPSPQSARRTLSRGLPGVRPHRSNSNSLIRSLSPSPALNLHHPPPTHTHIISTSAQSVHVPLPAIPEPGNELEVVDPRRSSVSIGRERGGRRSSLTTVDGEGAAGLGLDFGGGESGVEGKGERLSTEETARLAAVFCAVWFAANWSVNASLGYTSVGSSTVLAGMSGFFTLGIGRMLGVESFSKAKVMAVFASFIGLILVTHSDSNLSTSQDPLSSLSSLATPEVLPPISSTPKNAILGDMLALCSAFCYGIYVILLKKKIGDEENIDMQLFFGFVGLFNTIFLLPLVPVLHYLGVETFELPSKKEDLVVCAVNMLITLSSDYLYVLAMLKTTPLVVTVGLSLTIPFAMAGDFLRGSSSTLTIQSLMGAGLVIVGFLLMGMEGMEEGTTVTAVEEIEVSYEGEHGDVIEEEEEGVEERNVGKGKQRQGA